MAIVMEMIVLLEVKILLSFKMTHLPCDTDTDWILSVDLKPSDWFACLLFSCFWGISRKKTVE